MYVLYVTQFCLCPGSKNPYITLKIAEIRTDNLGQVSACSVPQNFLFHHEVCQRDVQSQPGFSPSDCQHTGQGVAFSFQQPVS